MYYLSQLFLKKHFTGNHHLFSRRRLIKKHLHHYYFEFVLSFVVTWFDYLFLPHKNKKRVSWGHPKRLSSDQSRKIPQEESSNQSSMCLFPSSFQLNSFLMTTDMACQTKRRKWQEARKRKSSKKLKQYSYNFSH